MTDLMALVLGGGIIAIVIILAFFSVWAIATAITGFILTLAWNALLVPVAHLPFIGFWQGVAGSVLLQIVGGAVRGVTTRGKS